MLRNGVRLAAPVVRHLYTQRGQLPEVHPVGPGSGDLYEPEASRRLHQLPWDGVGRSDERDGALDLHGLFIKRGVGIDPRHPDAVRRVPAVGLQLIFARRHHMYRRGQNETSSWGWTGAIIGLGYRFGKAVSVVMSCARIRRA